MPPTQRMTRLIVALSVVVSIGWMATQSRATDADDAYYKIDKGLYYLKEVFETVSSSYVDDLDPEGLSRAAIEGMLKEFDPYTVFFEDPGSNQMRMITRGTYGGVGMEIGHQDERIVVIAPMEGTPAKLAGIRAGDIITQIDDAPVGKMTLDDASRKLRGKIGTTVSLVLERPGFTNPIRIELTRQEIVIKDVSYAAFIAPNTAYIKLSGFSDKAGRELREAIRELQAQDAIEQVVLDLRGNPGGLLTAAVDVANVFLPPGTLVVSTRGKHENENKFYTKDRPLLPVEPLVVMIDGSSASASEIVAGALQDLDRAVLIGATTFGKGLVQKVYPIDRVTQAYLKITTAKYYVPSGRSIQKEDYKTDTRIFTDHSDSLEYDAAVNFYTQNGRIVHGGGGIQPDIAMGEPELDAFLQGLLARALFFRFTVDYLSRHPDLKSSGAATVDEAMLAEFRSMVERESITFELPGEGALQSFLNTAGKEGYDEDVTGLVTVALQKLEKRKAAAFSHNRATVARILSEELAEQLRGAEGRIASQLEHDPLITRAIEVLNNSPRYEEILAITR